jgi:uncharacterized protein (DUF885 family)
LRSCGSARKRKQHWDQGFDLRRFDDAIVLGGSVPMTLLEAVIEGFIAKSKN